MGSLAYEQALENVSAQVGMRQANLAQANGRACSTSASSGWDVTMNERAHFFAVRLIWRRGLLIPNCMPTA